MQEREFIPSMANFVDDTESQVYSTKNFLMFEVRQPYAHRNRAVTWCSHTRSPAERLACALAALNGIS